MQFSHSVLSMTFSLVKTSAGRSDLICLAITKPFRAIFLAASVGTPYYYTPF